MKWDGQSPEDETSPAHAIFDGDSWECKIAFLYLSKTLLPDHSVSIHPRSEKIREAMGLLSEPTGDGNVTPTLDFAVMVLCNGCLDILSFCIRMVFALERGAVLVGVPASPGFAFPGSSYF